MLDYLGTISNMVMVNFTMNKENQEELDLIMEYEQLG